MPLGRLLLDGRPGALCLTDGNLPQAVWRGWILRKRDSQRKKEARRKISAANKLAQKAPHKQLGVRCREALDVLLASRNLTTVCSQPLLPLLPPCLCSCCCPCCPPVSAPAAASAAYPCLSSPPTPSLGHTPDATSAHPCLQALAAVEAVELSTRYSRSCCKLMVENGGFSALLLFVRGCNRSKPHVEMLKRILAILAHVCRYPELVRGVFESDDCVSILSERLQFFRDIEASCGLCTSTHTHTSDV
jgi:hypothetical protein